MGHSPHPPAAPRGARGARRGAQGGLGKGGGLWYEEKPPRPPTTPPTPSTRLFSSEAKHLRVNPHTTGRRQNGSPSAAGRRTRHQPEHTAIAHRARAHPPEESTGRALAGPGGRPSPRGRGASRLTQPPRTPHRRAPSGPTRGHRGADRRRGRWGWERHTTARPREPEGQPGALQEHRKGPGGANARANPPGGQHDGPAGQHPHRCGGGPPASRQPQEARARGACRVRGPPDPPREAEGGGGTARSGRVPHPMPSQRTTRRRGRGERRGPCGQGEKKGPIRHECPPLARRGSDTARESMTSPYSILTRVLPPSKSNRTSCLD
ncbi:basic salivary proline-rich protein 4-like [Pan paniscus]|uniref:basic salivary proline-rich protein 4-like n=1 Tax=Pan paniscus TaxID=9597 RepID=UPI0024365F31|nr:basic salivary proline-rich protein 4-like [Pan paniscus]